MHVGINIVSNPWWRISAIESEISMGGKIGFGGCHTARKKSELRKAGNSGWRKNVQTMQRF